MNFAGHAAGGLAAAAASLYLIAGPPPQGLPAVCAGDSCPTTWAAVALVALGFSLFPDLDTPSRPQRLFYRGLLVAGLALAWLQAWQELALLALASLLPLWDHHRGWTHRLWVPWVLLPLGWWCWISWRQDTLQGFDKLQEAHFWLPAWPFLLAAVLGHGSHLLLDHSWTKILTGNPRR